MRVPPPHFLLRRDRRAALRLQQASRLAALVGTILGAMSLVGWIAHLPVLRSLGGAVETQPNAAVGVALVGIAALLASRPGRRSRWIGGPLAVAAALVGAVTLLEYVSGRDLGIDRLFIDPGHAGVAVTSPGRMGPPAALAFVLLGASLILSGLRSRRARIAAQALALGAAPLPLVAVVGYAYDAAVLYRAPGLSAISLPVALGLAALVVAALLCRPAGGVTANLVTTGAGSAIARRMLLYAIGLPSALGWAALMLSRAQPDAPFAVSIVVVAVTLGMVALVLRDASVLDRMEVARLWAQLDRERSREELARALEREREARGHAEAASRARDEFLNALSHELRTPLNAILGWARLLRDAAGDPERLTRGLSVIDRNGRALAGVVSDLLDMSRITRGVIQLEKAEVDLVSAVEAAVEGVRPAAQARGVALYRTVDDALPHVVGDPARLQQVAWNLLSNAVKFTPAGGRVDVRLAEEGGEVALTVKDTGDGIEPEFLPQVFERFRQADGSSTRRHGGLGLGLALTRELVVLHGGRVEVTSPGKGLGATFRVLLPAAPAEPEAARAPRRDRVTLGGARILVVDDEADARELLLQLLASWGARPVGAASAAEGVSVAAAERVDLVVSDIAMPGQDGFAFLQELRRLERALGQLPMPAVALTAYGRPEDRRRVLAGGFDAHFAKPVEPEELRATLAALLKRDPRPVAPRPVLRAARAEAPPPDGRASAARS